MKRGNETLDKMHEEQRYVNEMLQNVGENDAICRYCNFVTQLLVGIYEDIRWIRILATAIIGLLVGMLLGRIV